MREAARFLVGVMSVVWTWRRPPPLPTCGLVVCEASERWLRFLGVPLELSSDTADCCAQGSLRVIVMSFWGDRARWVLQGGNSCLKYLVSRLL